ncbi:MAG: hypothetical protein P1P76_10675 [Anaerolineales bacterium]|nr:hypothetical protein [Anaerolineales bacterium]
MKVQGKGTIADFLGDFIVYRNLIPIDSRLRESGGLKGQLPRPGERIPRKSERAYAEFMSALLSRARALDRPQAELERLLYIGDTRLNDGRAFTNLCRAGEWRGVAFICEDSEAPAELAIERESSRVICSANRWSFLLDFDAVLADLNFVLDENTAVVVDLDKTAIGARGRNDSVIDLIRLDAAREMAQSLTGDGFDSRGFEEAYHLLNRPRFHALTSDNQDYLAFICLMLAGNFMDLQSLLSEFEEGRLQNFASFLSRLEEHKEALSAQLREIHESVRHAHALGDPTPFKSFRRMEYLKTVERMAGIAENQSVRHILENRIVITSEVLHLAEQCRERGALLFGLSDKPDEASLPAEEMQAQGWLPVHLVETQIVGS